MKKQIVLSLSVLVVAMSCDVFAITVRRAGASAPVAAPAVQRNNTSPAVQQPSVEPVVSKSADAGIVAKDMSLSDVYVALEQLGAKADEALEENVTKAINFIRSGEVSTIGNKSNMLGRLGNKKK